MTSSILFFCTQEEENLVWKYLSTGDIAVLLINPDDIHSVTSADFNILPPWPEPLTIFFHHKPSGNIQWHRRQPKLNTKTHNTLVNTLLAREKWKELGLQPNDGLLNFEHSPLQIYHRGLSQEGKIGPCKLVCPPSNPSTVSVEYKKWCERSKHWIRNNSIRIHDWQHQSELLANPLLILSSIYAFPKAKKEIETGNGKYIILLR